MNNGITIHIEGSIDDEICLTLSPKYETAKIMVHANDLKSSTITSDGSAGHEVTIEAGETYEKPIINILFLKGENIRYHGSGNCVIQHLSIDCKNIKIH